MRLTSILCKQVQQVQQAMPKNFRSLALTVYFKHPEFDMQDYETLSRASAFLLSVDPPPDPNDGPYGHLERAENLRKMKAFKRIKGYSPPRPGVTLTEMGWLEFAPREHRPTVHVVASSHVVAPFLWREYYPQDWLQHVKQEHCKYTLEVFDGPNNSLAKFALDGQPFHHPEGRDVAFVHMPNEKEILPLMKNLGVEIMYLREDSNDYEYGEKVTFDGYGVTVEKPGSDEPIKEEDRVFYPIIEEGTIQHATKERFYAPTSSPLPEGMCGAPAIGPDGRIAGVVEGIVPINHEEKSLAGSAGFMPHPLLSSFKEYAERLMLQALYDPEMFKMVEMAKKTNTIGGGLFKQGADGKFVPESDPHYAAESMKNNLKSQFSKEEYDAIMDVIEAEKAEVKRIMETEGGDIMEVSQRVRARTLKVRDMLHQQYLEAVEKQKKGTSNEKK